MPYSYVTTETLSEKFNESKTGKILEKELLKKYERSQTHKNALSHRIYSLTRWEIFKTCLARELLLMKRNSFVHMFKTAQVTTLFQYLAMFR